MLLWPLQTTLSRLSMQWTHVNAGLLVPTLLSGVATAGASSALHSWSVVACPDVLAQLFFTMAWTGAHCSLTCSEWAC
jgi:hypothetical protein